MEASAALSARIAAYGKENLDDILHVLAEELPRLSGFARQRIYLEDLTNGSLSCVMATGPGAELLRGHTFPINSDEFLVSRVYASRRSALQNDTATLTSSAARQLARRYRIGASCMLPLLHNRRAIGVVCIDSEQPGHLPDNELRRQLSDFFTRISAPLNQARKYHQQLLLARRMDEQKKHAAALYMVKSAVRLIDNLTLASVLIPAAPGDGTAAGLQVLASYSQEKQAKKLYDEEHLISLAEGESLLSRYIGANGIITDDNFLQPMYFADLHQLDLQKRYLTEQLGLKSLYVVPRYEAHTRRVICVVNYYTSMEYKFTAFERGLLNAHAEMAERVIQEIGGEHMEIQVLAEISDLLQQRFDGLQPFLSRVLSKATELIGADTGSIALVEEREDGKWLVVEDEDGRVIGAKSKEWRKKNIPPIRIGGHELPRQQRSLTGYAAHSASAQIIANTETSGENTFYRALSSEIKSELAVPVVSEGNVLAVICLDSEQPYYFTAEHQRILHIIERMIARHLLDLQHIEALTSEITRLRSDVGYRDPKISSYKLGNIIGKSQKGIEVVEFIQTVVPPLFNRLAAWQRGGGEEASLGLPSILITGDTGSGKEFLFNNIYSRLNEMYQHQTDGTQLPLKKSNIAAYSGELTYSELFGHKRGAFTGAHTDRKGILEEAHGGVVFLDEIGDADPKTQVQLLRFLDNGGFVRLGENTTRYARVLLIAATNKNLHQLIEQGRFREDLYHRLSELSLRVPSLNERRDDIPDLSTHFLGKLYRVYQGDNNAGEPPLLTPAACDLLKAHNYSGNIRELRSILLRALFFHQGNEISAADISRALPSAANSDAATTLTQRRAQQIYTDITSHGATFWDAVYQPYSASDITRATVIAVIELARSHGHRTMPRLATALNACDPRNDAERKIFYKFKNFLYKTIRIN